MAHPTELADLSAELRQRIPVSSFRFEWSSQAQGKHLLLCGDWNRNGRRSSRTLYVGRGEPLKKGRRSLSTDERYMALEAATTLVKAWREGSDTRQRCKRALEPASIALAFQRKVVRDRIRSRDTGHGTKQKHLRHLSSLFEWLDERNQTLDAPSAIAWAGGGVERNSDNYADRLRIAQWACEWNSLEWTVPANRRAKKPEVQRPFVDQCSDADLGLAFGLIKDVQAATFFRVIAATGCRPSEVALFDWERWESEGRPQALHGYSTKVSKDFVAIVNPLGWLQGIDPDLLRLEDVDPFERPVTEQTRALLTRHYSRLLKLVQNDLRSAGWELAPTWTDLRHMWTIRAEETGYDMRTAAISQAHSHKMAAMVYLRHGEKRQVLAEIKRHASLHEAAA